jgi:PIN domain nuclease of toxin-antitoxin system
VESLQEVILLDTHALLWMVSDPAKLSGKATNAIRTASSSDGLAVSAITLWELAWLATNRRVTITGTVSAFVQKATLRTSIRPITVEIATLATQFPDSYPGDPCDRLIGATALSEGMALVTKDRELRNCKQLRTIW